MNEQTFSNWLEDLKLAWETRNPEAALKLCAESFLWFETPFEKPFKTRKELLNEWQSVLDHDDVKVNYEILSVEDNFGIAKWNATFIRLSSKEKAELEGIYKVSLDKNGLCIEFHQWYNSK